MDTKDISLYEQRLVKELAEIEKRIKELTNDKYALRRLLVKAQKDDLVNRQITRKNSANKVLIETMTLNTLRDGKTPQKTEMLFRAAKTVDTNLKRNTFRSHLHRMKKRGLIANPTNVRGTWKIVDREQQKMIEPSPFG